MKLPSKAEIQATLLTALAAQLVTSLENLDVSELATQAVGGVDAFSKLPKAQRTSYTKKAQAVSAAVEKSLRDKATKLRDKEAKKAAASASEEA